MCKVVCKRILDSIILVYGNNVAHNAIGVRTFTLNIWHGATILSMIIISLTMRNKQKSLFLIPHRLMRTIYGKTVLGAITGIIVERAITGAITCPSYPNASQVELSAVWNTPYVVGGINWIIFHL